MHRRRSAMSSNHDVVIVGGRCAGAATAYLFARKGYRVLVIDQAAFPSDTLSTHFLQPCGVQRLARWGVLPEVAASGAPPVHRMSISMDGIVISGSPRTGSGEPAPGY